MTKYEILEWDSKFFGFGVAQIYSSELQNEEIEKLLTKSKQNNIKLVYLFSVSEFENKFLLEKFNGKFADKKTLYGKDNLSKFPDLTSISPFEAETPTKEMYNLALQSGAYSRFKIDDKIESGKFEQLYSLWIENSTNKSIADIVLVNTNDNKINGMVTLANKKTFGKIGIIAVDENTRGLGVGKKLMQSTENWAFKNKLTQMQVVTQGENTNACKFYESNGYKVLNVQYLYHFWL